MKSTTTIKVYGGLAEVHCAGYPTDFDQLGRDGLYVDSVDIKHGMLGALIVLIIACFEKLILRKKHIREWS